MISLSLKKIAQKENLCVQLNASLDNVIELMHSNKKGVVVVLEGKRPIGILTERDVIEIIYRKLDIGERADTYARKTLITTKGDRTIGHALNLMIENNIRRIVVTDDADNFIGVITQQDLLRHLEEDIYRSTIRIKHILEGLRYLISVSPEDSLSEVLKKMIENNSGAVAVIRGRVAVGIMTEKDVLHLASNRISLDNQVASYMSRNIVTASLDTTLIDVVKLMNNNGIRRVIIVDDRGCAINIVTIRDVLRSLEGDYTKFLERKLKHSKDIMHLLPEMLLEVTDTGEEQVIIWANEKVISKFGKEIIAKPVTDLIPEEKWKEIYHTLNRLSKIENVKFKREDCIYELSGFFIMTEGELEKGRSQLIIRDITEDVKLSTTDPLTMIYNRRFINEFMVKEIERSKRKDNRFSIAILDMDEFKKINDIHGHLNGDLVLKSFTHSILDTLRKSDVIGRYGGDEFVIIMPETSHEMALHVISRLRKKIEETDITLLDGNKVNISASFGIATFPEDGTTSDTLLVNADAGLYNAKKARKHNVACF